VLNAECCHQAKDYEQMSHRSSLTKFVEIEAEGVRFSLKRWTVTQKKWLKAEIGGHGLNMVKSQSVKKQKSTI